MKTKNSGKTPGETSLKNEETTKEHVRISALLNSKIKEKVQKKVTNDTADTGGRNRKKSSAKLFSSKKTAVINDNTEELLKQMLAGGKKPEKKEGFLQSLLNGKSNEKIVFEEPPVVLELPPFETEYEVLDRYWLNPPYAYVNIYRDTHDEIHYQMIEPKLSEKELVILEESFEHLRSMLVYDTVKKRGELELDVNMLREVITSFDNKITPERRDTLIYYLKRNFTGYGRLDALMQDDKIEDITCNGSDTPLFLYHRRFANMETNIEFDSVELNKYVLKLAQKADKQLSLTTPLVDAALPNGSRAQITYSDIVSAKGSSFTIRKFKADPMTPVDLVASNTYSSEVMAYIWLAVENRRSMIIAGGTASGKTSTMNAASFFIPSVAKIVSIEDTREIQLPHVNWLAMKTRESSTSEGMNGNITMFSLLKAALRQRPEYIIVGEVRGEEAQTLFQAMNTGHTTYSTLHAGNVNEAVNRLINDPINVPIAMFGALNLVLIQSLLYGDGKGFRRCLSLNEIRVIDDKVTWQPLFVWNNQTDTFDKVFTKSEVFDTIAYQNGWDEEELARHIQIRKKALENMTKNSPYTVKSVRAAITETLMQEKAF